MNKIFTKITSAITVLCMMFGCVSAIPTYAKENDMMNSDVLENNTIVSDVMEVTVNPRAGNDTFYYGQVKEVCEDPERGFVFTDTNLTPQKYIENDPRIHRLIFKINASTGDMGRTVQFRFTVIRQNGARYTTPWNDLTYFTSMITNNPGEGGMNEIFVPVSGNETIQFYFECRSVPGSNLDGVDGRQVWIHNYQIYVD